MPKGFRSLKLKLLVLWVPPRGRWELNLYPLGEQDMYLRTEPFLQSYTLCVHHMLLSVPFYALSGYIFFNFQRQKQQQSNIKMWFRFLDTDIVIQWHPEFIWNSRSLNILQRQFCYNYHPGRAGFSELLRFHTPWEAEEEVAAWC